ncbi:TIGR00266 family protein [Cyanothece sp. BG0011]|uniref:TIGR00266 family protein n=1 Tax=Cyanothece sp. BG0011 TaxID=2082950 RepID=UPI000D1DE969|nr:TIGR00266 family protein [Cyanothece sp. BG0011]
MNSYQPLDYIIENNPDSGYLVINLKPSQKVFVKESSLSIKDYSIEIGQSITTQGSQLDVNVSLSANLSINEVIAPKLPGSIYLIPDVLGSVKHYALKGKVGIITKIFSFLACSENIQLRLMSSPIIKQVSEQDSFFLYLAGIGDLWLNYYGNIQEISVAGNYLINLSYLVAFEDTLNYEIKELKGLSLSGLHIGSIGEHNLFCHFQGKGKIWIQSRHRYALLNFFAPFIH